MKPTRPVHLFVGQTHARCGRSLVGCDYTTNARAVTCSECQAEAPWSRWEWVALCASCALLALFAWLIGR